MRRTIAVNCSLRKLKLQLTAYIIQITFDKMGMKEVYFIGMGIFIGLSFLAKGIDRLGLIILAIVWFIGYLATTLLECKKDFV